MTKNNELSKQKEVTEGQDIGMEKDNVWALVSPDKAGRATAKTPSREVVAVISASKFFVLSVDDVEDGEIQNEETTVMDDDIIEEDQRQEESEEDLLEDEILDQKLREKEKSGGLKGGRKVQKPKAQDANPKSKRSSRRKL